MNKQINNARYLYNLILGGFLDLYFHEKERYDKWDKLYYLVW